MGRLAALKLPGTLLDFSNSISNSFSNSSSNIANNNKKIAYYVLFPKKKKKLEINDFTFTMNFMILQQFTEYLPTVLFSLTFGFLFLKYFRELNLF